MASRKEYVYQIKGNKIALIERDVLSADGLNYSFSGTSGDGLIDGTSSGSSSWKSPISTVTDGLEIEYLYSPVYRGIYTKDFTNTDIGYSAWFNYDGYLTFVRSGYDWRNAEDQATITVGEDIAVCGSNRWTGVHKVKALGHPGLAPFGLQTETRISERFNYDQDGVAFVDDETITGVSNVIASIFSENDIVYLCNQSVDQNNGVYKIQGITKVGDDDHTFDFTGDSRYTFTNSYDQEHTLQAADFSAGASSAQKFFGCELDAGAYISANADMLSDESDTIDLPIYLTKALLLYVKAKVAEDAMNIEAKEYLMKEFRKMIEKHENGKIWGARQIQPGTGAIR